MPSRTEIPLWERYHDRLESYQGVAANFKRRSATDDPEEQIEEHNQKNGWTVDHYQVALPEEQPGPPLAGGSWEIACEVLRRYEFPDPDILTGIYIPEQALEQRVMLLKARFLFLNFWLGVRVGEILDEVRQVDGQRFQIWGYSYYTLEGHFERGEMTFSIWKNLDSGAIAFHIDAFSKKDHIANWFYRLGFFLFGRWIQVRFARQALKRMLKLVSERLPQRKA